MLVSQRKCDSLLRVSIVEVTPMRILLGAVLMVAMFMSGCAGWSQTPFNGRQSCEAVGGIYTSDERCLTGNQ
jgi:hypothetical protein